MTPPQPHHVDEAEPQHKTLPMPETPIQKTKTRLAKIYGVGALVFAAVLGSITVVALFLNHLQWS